MYLLNKIVVRNFNVVFLKKRVIIFSLYPDDVAISIRVVLGKSRRQID